MLRILFALAAAGGLGAVAGNATLLQLFDDVDWPGLYERLDERGLVYVAIVAAPILLWLVRGFVGWLITMAVVAGAIVLALRVGLEDDAPIDQIATLAAVYSVVGVTAYRLLTSRIFG